MKILNKKKPLRKIYLRLFVVLLVCFYTLPASAMTQGEVLPKIFDALGYPVSAKQLSVFEGDLTKADVVRLTLESMGWGFVFTAYERVTILPEWSELDPLGQIASEINPAVPAALLGSFTEPFKIEDLPALRGWIGNCKKAVSWKGSFSWEGTELLLIKHGIGNPNGPANGDLQKGVNEPLYAAVLAVDMKSVPCQIATAVMVGANKAPLATIAGENYGVIGGINGGYFSGAKPIGVLRRQGHMDNAKFWPNRSAFGWNDKGETIFIDGKEIANISGNGQLDIYTEMMQAGPLLMKKGSVADNTEKVHPNVLNFRHPRTLVGTDGKRIYWAVIDGRDKMHSVGTTIEETKKFCKWLGMTDALNLDGGGSSSLWWRGSTFTLPSNSKDAERPIPYAVLMFMPGAGVRN